MADTQGRDRLAPHLVIPSESRSTARRSLARSVVLVALLMVAFVLLPLRGEWRWLGCTVGLLAIAGTVPITIRRLHAVRRSEQPVVVALEAIVLLVSMLILGFAAVYFAIDFDQDQFNGLATRTDAVYFTVTTLSTVGFGDITATGQVARILVTVQILVDLAFIGIAVRVFARAAGAAH